MTLAYYSRCYSTSGVCAPQNYAQALKKLRETKPIRGEKANGRIPLGTRRYHARASISQEGDTIVLHENLHPFVEWSPDDTFRVNPPKYRSSYMCADLSSFLPSNMSIRWSNGQYVLEVIKNGIPKHYFLKNTLSFRPAVVLENSRDSTYELAEKPKAYHRRVRTSAYKARMVEYEPWLEWAGLVRSVDTEPTADEWKQAYRAALSKLRLELGLNTDSAWWDGLYLKSNTIDAPDDTKEKLYQDYLRRDDLPCWRKRGDTAYHSEAVATLLAWMRSPMSDNWVAALYLVEKCGGTYRWYSDRFLLTPDHAYDFIKDLVLHHHRDEVIKTVEAADGELPTKRNQEYFNTFSFHLPLKPLEKPLA